MMNYQYSSAGSQKTQVWKKFGCDSSFEELVHVRKVCWERLNWEETGSGEAPQEYILVNQGELLHCRPMRSVGWTGRTLHLTRQNISRWLARISPASDEIHSRNSHTTSMYHFILSTHRPPGLPQNSWWAAYFCLIHQSVIPHWLKWLYHLCPSGKHGPTQPGQPSVPNQCLPDTRVSESTFTNTAVAF